MDATAAGATEASGKAIAETAKFGGKVVDAAVGAGGYLARVVGTIPEDVLGVAGGDWLHQQRKRNLARMQAKTAAILHREGAAIMGDPSPSVVVPLLQAAADEGREELQDLWAALLAQAMKGERRVRRQFFEVLRQMEPADVLVLRLWMKASAAGTYPINGRKLPLDAAAIEMGLTSTEYQLSLQSLVDLKCISPLPGITQEVTALGTELIAMCEPSLQDPSATG